MLPRQLKLTKYVLDLLWLPIRVHIHICPSDMKQRVHLVAALRHHQSVCFSGWLEAEPALLGPPVVLEVVPAAFQGDCDDGPGVLVAG
jgi:hypothetical protein